MTNKPPFDGEVVRLGDVCEINPKAKRGLSDDDAVSFLPLASVHTDGGTELGEDVKRGDVRKGHPNFKRGDILLAKITPSFENGKIAIAQIGREYGYSSTEFHVIRPKKEIVNTGFLMAFLRCGKTINYCAHRMKGSAGQKRVPPEVIKSLKLPLPPFAQQEEIANRFASITDLMAIQDTRLARFDSLVKSRFVEMFGNPVENSFGWPCKRLGDLGELKNGVNFKAADSGCEIKCLGVGDFKNRYAIRDMDLVSTVTLNGEPTENQILHDGDVVFVRSNGNKKLVGRSLAVFPGNTRLTFSGFCIRFRNASDRLLLDYMLGCLKSDSMRKAMTGRGANIQNLSQGLLSKVEMPLPPLELQREFSSFIAQVDKLRVALVRRG
jgi:type I restriction enzyme S subunit